MNRKVFFALLVVVLSLAAIIVPASAVQPAASQGTSLDAPIWSVEGGRSPIVPPDGIQPMCGGCGGSGGNCSC